MIPLVPTLALAFLSFLCSAFVILRIVIPILPPHPLSKKVAPVSVLSSNFRSLSAADKSHIWLASFDLLALVIFVWHAIEEATGGPSDLAIATQPLSAVRVWFFLTIRQTCLLVVAALTLIHVRVGRSVSFGATHWMLWAPVLLLAVISTALAGVMSGARMLSLFIGLLAYTSSMAVLSTLVFGFLIGTLVIIKRNLAAINDAADPWPPVREVEDKARPSFATEDIDALRDGASWITSTHSSSSRHNSISQWSFTTHQTTVASSHHGHTRHPAAESHPSIPPKSSYWFSSSTPATDPSIPPVPPLPSPYGPLSPTAQDLRDSDPFRRMPTPLPDPQHPRDRLGSQTSWLTSTNGSHATLSAWSFPSNRPSTTVNRSPTPALGQAQVLGGYGYAPGSYEAEKGLAALAAPVASVDVSIYRAIGWITMIWVPVVRRVY